MLRVFFNSFISYHSYKQNCFALKDSYIVTLDVQIGYWGYGVDTVGGCKPCDCDMGGAVHNDCDQLTGQCVCRPNVIGRRCNELYSGYFSPELDYLILEAEEANITGV